MTKEKVAEAVKELPPEFELEDLIEQVIFTEKRTVFSKPDKARPIHKKELLK